jgi:D-serine deaminase-like pyridoxal phosphate-dependent protein
MLLDEARVRRNIGRMAQKARAADVRFRPHFKTHQSAQIGAWFRAEGVRHITASSLDMASYFADNGWDDITVAFPANLRELDKVNRLAARIRLHLLVESTATVQQLARGLTAPVAIWIEADTGSNRSGVRWDDAATLHAVASEVVASDRMALQGLLTHAGHTYAARSVEAIAKVYDETVTRMALMRTRLMESGFLGLELSIGDTPACSVLDDFPGVDELRPGNFVFYDLMQLEIGACTADEVAMVVACPVVANHPERGELVLYGGAVHLSKDVLLRTDGMPSYGAVVLLTHDGWSGPVEGAWLRSLSQEHGVVQATSEAYANVLRGVEVGALLGVMPVHSCLTADLLKHYLTTEGRRIDMAPIP